MMSPTQMQTQQRRVCFESGSFSSTGATLSAWYYNRVAQDQGKLDQGSPVPAEGHKQ